MTVRHSGSAPDFVHVCGPYRVQVLSQLYGEAEQRDCFCVAECISPFDSQFKFGQYHEHEEFIVALQAIFEPTQSRTSLLSVIGNIKDEQVLESDDDGITQQVIGRKGIALNKAMAVPNPVILKPYRTFLEIDQPESPFILRVARQEKGLPQVALFEADGGRWKIEAISRIRTWLQNKIGTLDVVILG